MENYKGYGLNYRTFKLQEIDGYTGHVSITECKNFKKHYHCLSTPAGKIFENTEDLNRYLRNYAASWIDENLSGADRDEVDEKDLI